MKNHFMKNNVPFVSESTLLPAASGNAQSVSSRPDSLELTVYQQGDAVVHETRTLKLSAGKNSVLVEGLPAQFVEDSFEIFEVSGPEGFKLGADCFSQADLSTQALLQKALNSRVTFVEQTAQGALRHSGKLLFILGNQVVLQGSEGVQVLPLTPKFELTELPRGLSATPSLTLEPSARSAGDYKVNAVYETGGLAWSARYTAYYDPKNGKLSGLRCRVKLSNGTGADYEDAVFKLLAGSNTTRSRGGMPKGGGARAFGAAASLESAMPMAAPVADSAQVESVGEQKLYVLPEPLSLRNGQTKRPYLFICKDVPVVTEFYLPQGYAYLDPAEAKEDANKLPVLIRLRLRNDKSSNLGTAMPAGQLDLYQPDSTGKYQKTDPGLYQRAVSAAEAFKIEPNTPCSDIKALRVLRDFQEDPAEEEQKDDNFVPEGGADFPVHTQGGPAFGTPEAHTRMRRELAENAAGESEEQKKPKPRFRTEAREVTVFNFKDEPVLVRVHEALPSPKAEILNQTQPFVELSQGQGSFSLSVPAKGKASVSYGVRWQIN